MAASDPDDEREIDFEQARRELSESAREMIASADSPVEMLFHVKLPFASATTVSAWRDGVPPVPQPTHYEAWVSLPDLVAIIQCTSRQPGDCTYTLKEVREMGWLPPGSRAKLEAVRYAAGDLLNAFVATGHRQGWDGYAMAPSGPRERLTKAIEDAGSVRPLSPGRAAGGAEEEYARHMGAQ